DLWAERPFAPISPKSWLKPPPHRWGASGIGGARPRNLPFVHHRCAQPGLPNYRLAAGVPSGEPLSRGGLGEPLLVEALWESLRVGESTVLTRPPLVRALLASAAIAAALALAGCDTDGVQAVGGRHMQPLSDRLAADLEAKRMDKESPILVRIFKEESELE